MGGDTHIGKGADAAGESEGNPALKPMPAPQSDIPIRQHVVQGKVGGHRNEGGNNLTV